MRQPSMSRMQHSHVRGARERVDDLAVGAQHDRTARLVEPADDSSGLAVASGSSSSTVSTAMPIRVASGAMAPPIVTRCSHPSCRRPAFRRSRTVSTLSRIDSRSSLDGGPWRPRTKGIARANDSSGVVISHRVVPHLARRFIARGRFPREATMPEDRRASRLRAEQLRATR